MSCGEALPCGSMNTMPPSDGVAAAVCGPVGHARGRVASAARRSRRGDVAAAFDTRAHALSRRPAARPAGARGGSALQAKRTPRSSGAAARPGSDEAAGRREE